MLNEWYVNKKRLTHSWDSTRIMSSKMFFFCIFSDCLIHHIIKNAVAHAHQAGVYISSENHIFAPPLFPIIFFPQGRTVRNAFFRAKRGISENLRSKFETWGGGSGGVSPLRFKKNSQSLFKHFCYCF